MRTYFEGKIFGQKSHIYTSSAQDNADPDAAVDFEVYFHSVTFFFFKILLSQAKVYELTHCIPFPSADPSLNSI